MATSLRDKFLLDPDVVFLNHGSFGAVPQPVFATFQHWQREAERQPVEFFRRSEGLLNEARATIGAFLKSPADNLIFVPNATTGLNIVIRSLALQPGDEILATDHEYGALNRTWALVCQKTGAHYRQHPLPLPATDQQAWVESLWGAVTPRTRVLFLSHLTSPTALILPIAELIRRARAAGILSVIDGAHVPGHLPLDLTTLDPDFYSGNFHKWLSAPRGSAFLYVRPEHQLMLEPMTVSHGWGPDTTFIQRHQWQGTRDLTAFLSVPAAIEFWQQHDWEAVCQRGHALARLARQRVAALTGVPPLTPDSNAWFGMLVALATTPFDPATLKEQLYQRYKIEIPVFTWQNHHIVRLSCPGYVTEADIDRLVEALADLLPG